MNDPDRAAASYTVAFGWEISAFPGSPSNSGLPRPTTASSAINGALMQGGERNNDTRLTMGVESIEDATALIIASGGTLIQAKAPVPGMGYVATFLDTEGNSLRIFPNDPSATM